MARKIGSVKHLAGFKLDVSSKPGYNHNASNPAEVGDIYRPHGGPPGFWWVISINQMDCMGNKAHYLTFNYQGNIVGSGWIPLDRLNEREKVGHMDLPTMNEVEWY